MQSDNPTYLKGAVFGLAAVCIWAGWSANTRLAVMTNFDAWDIPALRFGVAGLLLSPILIRRGLARERLGWLGLVGIIVGQGAPYVLVAALGLRFASAADLGSLSPGCMPIFVALIAATILEETPSTTQKYGLSLIFVGALIMVSGHGWAWNASRTFGDATFLVAGFLTACFTVIMRQAKLDPIHAAALVSTGSVVIYTPLYFALRGTRLVQVPLADVAVQLFFQGVVVSILALVLYGRAVVILGASGGSSFGALVPALSALFAIPVLGEWPNITDWPGIVLISSGVYLASGAPIPALSQQKVHRGRRDHA
jgi:drug/metabolite transporter (DMT)-like permease